MTLSSNPAWVSTQPYPEQSNDKERPLVNPNNTHSRMVVHDDANTNPNERVSSPRFLESNPVIDALAEELVKLKTEEEELSIRVSDLDLLYATRMEPLQAELKEVRYMLQVKQSDMDLLLNPPDTGEQPPGPAVLRFVDGSLSQFVSSSVIFANMVIMVLELQFPETAGNYWLYDQIFLFWYCCELGTKALLHRRNLLIGPISIVWWNWLDSSIVFSGVLDQWMVPALKAAGILQSKGGGVKLNFLRMLRLLRLFRIMRVLKIVKVFLKADLSWTEDPPFQQFIIGIIVVNSILMSLELDFPFPEDKIDGWYWFEQILLVIYSFELSVRLKRWGWKFFYHPEDMKMNCLDFIIVSGGVVESWMLPSVHLIETLITGKPPMKDGSALGNVMSLLRMMRLLRVLRLIRLVRNIKPLYRLLFGLVAALEGIQWVLLLAAIMLYAASILFTSVIGHGLIYPAQEADPQAKEIFGSVMHSMFELFKVMAGDQSVVEPLIDNVAVKVLFMFFVILSNWIMLAILTAVVSDNMIAESETSMKEDAVKEEKAHRLISCRRLIDIFAQVDGNGNGTIEEDEFMAMIRDPDVLNDIKKWTGLDLKDLEDLWIFLSTDEDGGRRTCRYADFTQQVLDESSSVTERSVYRLEKRVQNMERGVRRELRGIRQLLGDRSVSSNRLGAMTASMDCNAGGLAGPGSGDEGRTPSGSPSPGEKTVEGRSFFHKLHRATYYDLDKMGKGSNPDRGGGFATRLARGRSDDEREPNGTPRAGGRR